ncbi:hypothetical protein FPQ18DRAFT_137516 [Pyronema domesticum]|nr:hypothetical protein FPQ18DRAFT_137516 [Pyronema domesticum]
MSTTTEQPTAPPLCRRCKEHDGIYVLRNEPPHCRGCYEYFIRSKCVKRMESYKIRADDQNQIPTFLLPISFGISSTSLLYLIDSQLAGQRQKVTRTRYRLKILNVDESVLDPSLPSGSHLEVVKQRFPDAGDYIASKLEDIYSFTECADIPDLEKKDANKSPRECMQELLTALPSPTSREDMAGILRTRLIVAIAQREGCSGILWGDTTTRLADKVMAEAAKGRGFSLPWQISDTKSPYGLKFLHPLRDVFKKELVTFVTEITEPPLVPLCIAYSLTPKHSAAAATSGRNITVGELLTQYFDNMELQYPSTVMNVVRMGDRLKPSNPEADPCTTCGLPADENSEGLTLGSREDTGEARGKLCYGCMRATHGAAPHSWPVM